MQKDILKEVSVDRGVEKESVKVKFEYVLLLPNILKQDVPNQMHAGVIGGVGSISV